MGARADRLRRARWRVDLLPVIVYLLVAGIRIWEGDFAVDTGWYSAIAVQAWRDADSTGGGSLWTLMGVGGQGGIEYFNKPPLGFWIHGLVLWVLGPSVLSARLPSVLAGAVCVALTGAIARRVCGARAGILSALVLATTIEFTRHTRALSLDMWNTVFILVLVWGVVAGTEGAAPSRTPRWRWVMVAGAGLGLALLSKPLVGLLAVPALWLWSAMSRDRKVLTASAAAALIGLAIAAPWHLSMVMLHGDRFVAEYFEREVAQRAGGHVADLNQGASDPLYYLGQLARSGWPWLATMVLGLLMLARGRCKARARAGVLLAVAWLITWLVALSVFPDKRPRYLLPVYPAMAWLSGAWLVGSVPAWLARARRMLLRWGGVAAVAACVVITLLPVRLSRPAAPQWVELSEFLRIQSPQSVWLGGFDGARGARVYLSLGWWPRITEAGGVAGNKPSRGSIILYHRLGGVMSGESETVVFQSGDVTATRLDSETWTPISRPSGQPDDD